MKQWYRPGIRCGGASESDRNGSWNVFYFFFGILFGQKMRMVYASTTQKEFWKFIEPILSFGHSRFHITNLEVAKKSKINGVGIATALGCFLLGSPVLGSPAVGSPAMGDEWCWLGPRWPAPWISITNLEVKNWNITNLEVKNWNITNLEVKNWNITNLEVILRKNKNFKGIPGSLCHLGDGRAAHKGKIPTKKTSKNDVRTLHHESRGHFAEK